MIPTRTASLGQGTSPTRLPAYGLSSGRVSSTMVALPCPKVKIRTRSPTLTASSTRAVISRGVDTATSTPQASSNSHSFLGLLTRATVRGTPNSVLARRDTTRLALSSPVAATTTSQSAKPASCSELVSQASASSQDASGTRPAWTSSMSLSINNTWCPLCNSSRAIERPTLPAPAMTTRIGCTSFRAMVFRGLSRRWSECWLSVDRRCLVERLLNSRQLSLGRDDVDEVPVLVNGVRTRQDAVAQTRQVGDPGTRGRLELADPAADQGRVDRHVGDDDMAAGVCVFGDRALRQQPAQHLVRSPAHSADRGDAEALVYLRPAWVVDARDDVFDAVRLAGNAGSQDVGVVSVAHRGERVGLLDAGLDQGVAVESEAGHTLALEAVSQTAKGRAVGVDDGHIVALTLETARQGRTDPAATHDDEVHAATLHRAWPRSRLHVGATTLCALVLA